MIAFQGMNKPATIVNGVHCEVVCVVEYFILLSLVMMEKGPKAMLMNANRNEYKWCC